MQKRYWLLCGMILLGIMKLGETPGGYSPICFAGDVTRSMIEAYN